MAVQRELHVRMRQSSFVAHPGPCRRCLPHCSAGELTHTSAGPLRSVVLEKLTHAFVGRHDGETRLSTAFIVCLANQAGIILGRDYKAAKHINRK